MGLPGCLFVCHLILLLMCFLFNLVDLRIQNESMERTRIIQAPVIEDFIHKFHYCKVRSKLDLRQGYHQLLLDPQSRDIATFNTPWGNMRPKRLTFGAKSSQDVLMMSCIEYSETFQDVQTRGMTL